MASVLLEVKKELGEGVLPEVVLPEVVEKPTPFWLEAHGGCSIGQVEGIMVGVGAVADASAKQDIVADW
jgi:hypothetical protein